MKKYFLLFFLVGFFFECNAQSVLGIDFGSSYNDVKSALINRFGLINVLEDGGKIEIYNLSMGDMDFDYAEFNFQRNGSASYFNGAHFESHYSLSDVSGVEIMRDNLYDTLADKYKKQYLGKYTNDQGFVCYKFGLNPRDSTTVLGTIQLEKSYGKDGKMRLYLSLDYGPIYYLDKASDF